MIKTIFERLSKISDKELKELDIFKVKAIITKLGFLLSKVNGKSIYEEIEKLEIKCIIKLIKCPFLEKKIQGILSFKDIILKASSNNKYIHLFK